LERCGFKKGGVMRKAAYVNGRKWDGYHFDILRKEYSDMRMDLLKQTLGDRLEEYFRKHCTVGCQQSTEPSSASEKKEAPSTASN